MKRDRLISSDFSKQLFSFRQNVLKALKAISFTQLDPAVWHEQIIPLASYAPWHTDVLFSTVMKKIAKRTLVDIYRCYELWSLTNDLCSMDGDILEVGVWRGGTGFIMAEANRKGKGRVILADTFSGVVNAGDQDTLYKGGEHSDVGIADVETLFSSNGLTQWEIIQGVFPGSASQRHNEVKLKLCHIDVDTYISARDSFTWAWPRMLTGGVMVFDDYGFWGCEGVTKFVDSLSISDGIKIYNMNGHGLLVKTNRE